MRRQEFRADRAHALALLARAPFVHVAGIDDDGAPVMKTLHGVIVGERVCFHAAPAGEKMAVVGKPVVVAAEEIVAEIPSYFSDPVRACPATTLYESAQVHGVLERIDDLDAKAQALQALMERFQREGGHRAITAGDELYRAAVKGILILGVSLASLDGKSKLAQNRSAAERGNLYAKLWERGAPGDVRAIERVLAANPGDALPSFLAAAPAGFTLTADVAAREDRAARAEEVAALLDDAYWNAGVGRARIARAHLASSAWVAALDERGALAASARALGDGAKWATVYDVIVRPDVRGRGLGAAVVALLLDHPAVRAAKKVSLRTRDAQELYTRFGFLDRPASANPEMVLERP